MSEVKIGIQITADSQDSALLELISKAKIAQAELKNTGKAADESSGLLGKLGGSIKELAVAAGVTFGLAELAQKIREGAREAIAEERAMGALVLMLRQFDAGLTNPAERVGAFAEAMKKLAMDDDQVITGLRQLVPITGNYQNAARGVALAWNLSAASGEQYTTMLDLIAGLVANKPRSLVQAQMLLGEKVKDSQTALDMLFSRFGDYASKLDDQQMKVDKLSIKWHDLWKAVGREAASAILDGIELAGKLGDKLQWVADLIFKGKQAADMAAKGDAEKQKTAEHSRQEALRFHEESIAYFERELEKVQKGSDKWHEYTKAITENVDAWRKLKGATEDATPTGPPSANPQEADPSKAAAAAKAEADAKTQLAQADRDLAAAVLEFYQAEMKASTSPYDIARTTETALKARENLYDKELALLRSARDKELQQENLTGQAREAILKTYATRERLLAGTLETDLAKIRSQGNNQLIHQDALLYNREEQLKKEEAQNAIKWDEWQRKHEKNVLDLHLKDVKKMNLQELMEHRKELNKELELKRKLGQDDLEISKDLAETEIQIERLKASAKLQIALNTVAGLFGAASMAFGNNKALAIAETTISTIAGAQKAFEETPGPVWLKAAAAAAAVLMGVARVKQIEGTSMGGAQASAAGGYDIPEGTNPVVQAHAKEMILPADIAEPLRAVIRSMSSSTTFDHRVTDNSRRRGGDVYVTQHLLTGSHANFAYRELDRKLRWARAANDRALATPRVTRVGSKRRVS